MKRFFQTTGGNLLDVIPLPKREMEMKLFYLDLFCMGWVING